ncbi:armadillo repeat-containing protein 10 isoform X4 [Alligator mississippiensis]|uniref:armadillo repeat-containing protein 10 isoform X4 n=1 Tax=Alligator mississippiensis TaxID=8496 RepID=UPI0028772C19|nr:armadillo repeat-containing protein 10 isoform X4 [Alligator mississippiensis]
MGESGALGWRAGLAALVLGAGACYGLARLARSGGAAAAPRGTSGRGGACERRSDGDLPKSTDSLDANHLQKLIQLLESTDDPLIQEQILVTLSNSAAFSVNQDIIRNLDGLSVIGKMVSDSIPKVKEKALNALNNLSMNVKNQEELKEYIVHVCREIESSPLDSELQLAGLRLLTNMSVTNNYHPMMTRSIPYFFHLLSEGNERTQIQVLKVLVNLSANPAMTRHLLSSQESFTYLYAID